MYIRLMKRLVLFAPALIAGCYTYAPVQSSTLAPGTGVRARVSATAAERVAPLLGVSDARVLTGTLIDNQSGTLIVEVPALAQAAIGTSGQTLNQRISITPGDLVEIESRKLDRQRTALLVGAAVIVGASATVAALKGGPGLDRPPGGSSTDSRIPVRLWQIRF
jgi:hypothetical protein